MEAAGKREWIRKRYREDLEGTEVSTEEVEEVIVERKEEVQETCLRVT